MWMYRSWELQSSAFNSTATNGQRSSWVFSKVQNQLVIDFEWFGLTWCQKCQITLRCICASLSHGLGDQYRACIRKKKSSFFTAEVIDIDTFKDERPLGINMSFYYFCVCVCVHTKRERCSSLHFSIFPLGPQQVSAFYFCLHFKWKQSCVIELLTLSIYKTHHTTTT